MAGSPSQSPGPQARHRLVSCRLVVSCVLILIRKLEGSQDLHKAASLEEGGRKANKVRSGGQEELLPTLGWWWGIVDHIYSCVVKW